MRIFLLLCSLLFLIFSGANAQRLCTSDMQAVSVYKGSANNANLLQNGKGRDTIASEVIIVPVVIHIVYNKAEHNISDAQILSQIEVLNNDFGMLNLDASNVPSVFRNKAADSKIRFCIAQTDPSGKPTKGIIRKHTNLISFQGDDAVKFSAAGGDDAWDSKRYLNIWVCNMGGRSLGYAALPGGEAVKDGVVINYDVFGSTGPLRASFNKGRTATHEIAHWLGLKHIWGDETCGDDGVDDTPRQRSYNYGCPSFPRLSTCTSNGNGDMFMNFMDLTDDACMNMFTHGQAIKMRGIFALSGQRNDMLLSYQCDSPVAGGGPLLDEQKPMPVPSGLYIYPNPVRNYLTIAGGGTDLSGVTYTIYTTQGIKISEQKIATPNAQLNVSFLPAGVYYIKIRTPQTTMLKMVKL